MERFIKQNLKWFLIFFLIFAAAWIVFGLDTLEKLFTIIGSFSIGIALVTYFDQKAQDKTTAAIDQISFFRKEVIPLYDALTAITKKESPQYVFTRIDFDEPTVRSMKRHRPKNFAAQEALFFDSSSLHHNPTILDPTINLYNAVEEFALKVLHFKTQDHEALNAVRHPFVMLVEQNAVALVFIREIIAGSPIYSATLKLYETWKGKVKPTHVIDRLASSNFISESQAETIKAQRNSSGR